jgi:DNA-directed RNA polymerase subunit F
MVEIDTAKEIETLCRRHVKSKTLTDEAFQYMARLILEDCPRNASELYSLIQDFATDGMAYTEEEAFKICDVLSKILIDKKLIVIV